ncbi:hypothetical protein HPB50_008378 [Hyalomma asiaticum]|uniref:Uncharacterized protein n=1 Tax=Hyalomma asiaticum TaxID=266040 RepID=A0ACB7TE38_HYAAI|nr:hypothetical protein HPB50_008378 [Hyalomma asiaticum]
MPEPGQAVRGQSRPISASPIMLPCHRILGSTRLPRYGRTSPLCTGPDRPRETSFRGLCQQVTLYVLWEMCLLEVSRVCRGVDEGETNSKPPFRPTYHDNLGALPPLNEYESFLNEERPFCDGARKFHERVVASTPNAAASRHSKCFGHSGTLSLASEYMSSMGFETTTRVAILSRRLAVAIRRRAATKSTPPVCDGSVCKGKSEEFDELLLSKTISRASQKIITGDDKTKGRNQERRSSSTLTDISIRTGSLKTKTPRLDAKESVIARTMDSVTSASNRKSTLALIQGRSLRCELMT